MKIIKKLQDHKIHISFEVFPPKTNKGYEKVQEATEQVAKLQPSFVSVTYGAGGGTSKNTVRIASHIKHDCKVESLAHLTCASSTKAEVKEVVEQLKKEGIENILALRGDILPDRIISDGERYQYASELIQDLHTYGDFCIGAACYPEGHVETEHKEQDIMYLKHKVDCGVDFLMTQMFFDNNILYNFLYRIREQGITVPVVPGIMPVTNGKQIARICELSGTSLPPRFRAIADCFGDNASAMQQAGIAYSTEQIVDLIANGVKNIHVYSMNKPEVAAAIMENLSNIIQS
ncbi:MAG: methylenetetrahydrofolate reductase [NAD(P)H] [Lachnospiraceae bacterium]